MRRTILLALALASAIGCAAPFTGVVATAPTPACTRAYQDADAYITVCYNPCPADMEAYANVMHQSFTRVTACHA